MSQEYISALLSLHCLRGIKSESVYPIFWEMGKIRLLLLEREWHQVTAVCLDPARVCVLIFNIFTFCQTTVIYEQQHSRLNNSTRQFRYMSRKVKPWMQNRTSAVHPLRVASCVYVPVMYASQHGPTQCCLPLHSVCLLHHDLHVKHQQLTVVAFL